MRARREKPELAARVGLSIAGKRNAAFAVLVEDDRASLVWFAFFPPAEPPRADPASNLREP